MNNPNVMLSTLRSTWLVLSKVEVSKHGAKILALVLLAAIAMSAPASARTRTIDHGGTYWGTDVLVEPNQVIDGNVTVFFGDAIIEGTVNGDVDDIGGTIEERPGSLITGGTHVFSGDYINSFAPWAAGTGASTIMAQNSRMLSRLAYSLVVLLVFLIFPLRVRLALARLEEHPGLSTAVGTLAIVAIIPIMILLIVSIIGIPLIPLEFAAVLAGICIGQAALGLLVGRRLYELIRPHATPSPLGALVLGLVVISAAEIVPTVGGFITALVVLVGLGGAVLAFIRDGSFGPPATPISGPPMKPA